MSNSRYLRRQPSVTMPQTPFMKHLLPIFLLTSLVACQSDVVYRAEHPFPAYGWTYRDTVDFTFEVRDTSALYDMTLGFTHRDTFDFQNAYIRLWTRFPDGRRLQAMRSVELFDSKGQSRGSCSGHNCLLEYVLQENTYFNQPGRYVLTLEQFTRQDSLPGLEKIGLVIKKADRRRK